MVIKREWAFPSSRTFTVKPIKKFVERWIIGSQVIVDPFTNNCKYGTITNDLNPAYDTDYHLDALDFLKLIPDESCENNRQVDKSKGQSQFCCHLHQRRSSPVGQDGNITTFRSGYYERY